MLMDFLKRNPTLSSRKPQGVALNRVYGLNHPSVARCFDNLEFVLDKYKFKPRQMFNVDESEITTVHRPMKVISTKEVAKELSQLLLYVP